MSFDVEMITVASCVNKNSAAQLLAYRVWSWRGLLDGVKAIATAFLNVFNDIIIQTHQRVSISLAFNNHLCSNIMMMK